MSVPPATQKPCTLQTTGLSEWKRLMKPFTLRLIIWKSTIGSQTPAGSWFFICTAGSSGEPVGTPPPPGRRCSALITRS
jgi:hypothetical protein